MTIDWNSSDIRLVNCYNKINNSSENWSRRVTIYSYLNQKKKILKISILFRINAHKQFSVIYEVIYYTSEKISHARK